jgi:HK97 family phage major capsid protein
MKELIEKRTKLETKHKILKGIWDEAGPDRDLSLVKSNGFPELGNTIARLKRITEIDTEINDLTDEVLVLKAGEDSANATLEREKMMQAAVNSVVHPEATDGTIIGKGGQIIAPKGLGQMFIESKEYTQRNGNVVAEKAYYNDRDLNIKTLFETTAGFAPESVRSGLILPAATRPLQMADLIPTGAINQAAEVYMEQTTRTNTAAETAEGGAFNEATFVYTERSETVRKVTISLPVTDEQLEDEARISSIIQDDLMLMLRQRIDTQTLNGSGVSPDITGYLNKSGILTQVKGADPVPDAIFKLMTQIRVTGRAFPTAAVLHPNDWQEIRLLTTADGIYIWGSPSEAGPERIWGLPVVQADALAEGTGLVGDFGNPTYSQMLIRRGITLKITDSHSTDFVNGKQMIRADIRVAFVIRRAAAFGTVTGI